MEEILHTYTYMKSYATWDILNINWRSPDFFHQQYQLFVGGEEVGIFTKAKPAKPYESLVERFGARYVSCILNRS